MEARGGSKHKHKSAMPECGVVAAAYRFVPTSAARAMQGDGRMGG